MDRTPFIGIRPYTEADYDQFHGRVSVSDDLIERIMRYPITILTGPSGFGKSSLVNCGVVRPLKLARQNNVRGMSRPPFVVRDWGQARGDAALKKHAENVGVLFSQILLREARMSLDADSERAKEDSDQLAQEIAAADRAILEKIVASCARDLDKDPEAFLELVSGLSRQFGGIILVFDQFEEILREGSEAVREVSNLVVRMSRLPGISIMLSLRSEHLDGLRRIEGQVDGSLAQSKIHLSSMPFEDAKSVFGRMAEARGVDLDPKLLDHLRRDEIQDADLFSYQAILSEMWLALKEKKLSTKNMNVAALGKAFGEDMKKQPERAFEFALVRIIDRCFVPDETHDRTSSLRYRSHAIRVAPWLSAGDFKTSLKQSDLFDKVYGEAMRSIAGLGKQKLGLEVSGSFRYLHEANIEDAAGLGRQLRTDYVAMLDRLVVGNLLKRYNANYPAHKGSTTSADEAVWEITHDRLGVPLYNWHRNQLTRIKDCRNAALASKGVTPLRVDMHQALEGKRVEPHTEYSRKNDWKGLRWRGCSIERSFEHGAQSGVESVRFEGIPFVSCDFRGSVFVRCAFRRSEFDGCNLSGSAFVDCDFEDCEFRDMPEGMANSVGFFGCTFGGSVMFEECDLVQLTIAGSMERKTVGMTGDGIVIRGGKVVSSRFSDFGADSKGELRLEGVEDDFNWFDTEFKRHVSKVSRK